MNKKKTFIVARESSIIALVYKHICAIKTYSHHYPHNTITMSTMNNAQTILKAQTIDGAVIITIH